MTPAEIQAVAANAGFTGADLATAVAISLAETNPTGNPSSYNPETNAPGGTPVGQGSYGLWQIYLKDHPEFASENLMDPQTNANAAYQLYWQHGFTPWATYGSGKYRAYLANVPTPAMPSYTAPPPLTIDAATGLPVTDQAQTVDISSLYAAGTPPLSFGEVLLWGALGFFALWVFSEAT